jgi:hypothetical protein
VLAFTCDNCGQLVFFDNTACLACLAPLGVIPGSGVITLQPDDHDPSRFRRFTDPEGIWWRRCVNASTTMCNWLVPDTERGDRCRSCELTRTLPDASDVGAQHALTVAEAAKRRLLFQLDSLRMPVVSRSVDPAHGLAFDLLSSRYTHVTTGHADGVITIDLAESDDAHREWLRKTMGESYRTMLGHLRHEIGHYYWMLFTQDDPDVLARIREQFGDDTADYQAALDRHYAGGPPPGWEEHYVSNYATTHPWEDWAETFAHYLHIRGTLQTAAAYGVYIEGPAALRNSPTSNRFRSDPAHAVANASFDVLMKDWVPLTYALNEINRAMGKDRLYPFVLRPNVVEKLSLVHDLCVAAATATRAAEAATLQGSV